ncbi:hypothetical protein [Neptunicella sp. SCSIO 80796]|uniref:hypothetical protein n=1 Tax=Neptunicella plasticusilytica TaxID=3117012 RepID=UPI003A4E01E7
MELLTIEAGKSKNVQTSALYLSIISTTGQFIVKSPAFGELAGKVGRQFVLDGISEVEFFNNGLDSIEIEYETANIRIYGAGSGAVNIENTPTIKRIIEPIAVTASATVEDGKVRQIQPDNFAELDQVTINPGETKKVIDAREETSRRVTLYVESAEFTVLRVGGSATLSASQGGIMSGSVDAIGEKEFKTTAAIYMKNTSGTVATISGFEEWRE